MLKRIEKFLPEITIFLFALVTRFWRLEIPPTHYFDEVYHAFTAQQMYRGNPAAWEWWNTNPTGFAYEWTHPPLAKEFMWFAISIFGDGSFVWRFFSALFGFGSIVLIYFIALSLFKNQKIAILSAAVASLDGLLLVMSRIAMNDSYFLFFSLLALFLFLKDKKLFMGIALGLAIASKWTALFLIPIISVLFLIQSYKRLNLDKILRLFFCLIVIPFFIYLASYTPFFLGKHAPPNTNFSNVQSFIELQRQMWWYHTNLKATHPYQSRPEQWIFDLKPVWMFVNYRDSTVADIYSLDNPLIAWSGFISMMFIALKLLRKFVFEKFLIVFSYLAFFILWFISPRIMFNYHYLAPTAFLTIAIGFVMGELDELKRYKIYIYGFLLLLVILFFYFYPLWTGMYISKDFSDSHFWIQSWR